MEGESHRELLRAVRPQGGNWGGVLSNFSSLSGAAGSEQKGALKRLIAGRRSGPTTSDNTL